MKMRSLKFKVILIVGISYLITIGVTFIISYKTTKDQLLTLAVDMLKRINEDFYGFVEAQNELVKSGKITLEEAKETARIYALGPRLYPNDSINRGRDLTKSKMSSDELLYVYGIKGGKHNPEEQGFFDCHPFAEGVNHGETFAMVDGKKIYSVKESWGNPDATGLIIGYWQNPGEDLQVWIVYQRYFEPWDWCIGVPAREQLFYEQQLGDLTIRYILISSILFIISVLIVYFLMKRGVVDHIEILNRIFRKVSKGDITESYELKRNDEIGEMTTSLNSMMIKLREIITSIRLNSDNLASGSAEIASSAQTISQGANEQAASIEEISSSIEEMATTIQQNSQNAQVTKRSSQKAAKRMRETQNAMNSTIDAMKQIVEKTLIINEISEKTDLLAINAAIEAARAGVYGKGFAVVASEIRKLAENTQKAAEQIDKLSQINVQIAEKSGGMLDEAVPEIERTAQLVEEIATASIEQTSGTNQINAAIQQLNQLTQQNSSTSEELATSSQELATQTESQRKTVSFFILDSSEANDKMKDLQKQILQMAETIKVLNNKKTEKKGEINQIEIKEDKSKGIQINLSDETKDDSEFEKF